MTQQPRQPKGRISYPSDEQYNSDRPSLEAACGGNRVMGSLLSYFMHLAEQEAKHKGLDATCKVVSIIVSRDKILQVARISEQTFITYRNAFNKLGYVKSQRYSHESVYEVHFETIEKGIASPPARKLRGRPSKESSKNLAEENTGTYSGIALTFLKNALTFAFNPLTFKENALTYEEKLKELELKLKDFSHLLKELELKLKELELSDSDEARSSLLSEAFFEASKLLLITTNSHIYSFSVSADAENASDDVDITFPVAIGTTKDTVLQTEQGEDDDSIPVDAPDRVHDQEPRLLDGSLEPDAVLSDAKHEALNDFPESMATGSTGQSQFKSPLPLSQEHVPGKPGAVSIPSVVKPPIDDQGDTRSLAHAQQTTTPAELPPDVPGRRASGIQQVSRLDSAPSSLTPGQHVGFPSGIPTNADAVQAEQVYTLPEEWEQAQKMFLENLRTQWNSFSRQEKTQCGGKWDAYKKQQGDTWRFAHPKPKDETLEEACRIIYTKITTELRGYIWDTGGAVTNERTFIRNFVLKYRREHPDTPAFFVDVYTYMTTKIFKWSSDSYRYKVSASDVYHETESVLQLWKAKQNGHNQPSQNGKSNRNGHTSYVSVPEVFNYDRLKETPV